MGEQRALLRGVDSKPAREGPRSNRGRPRPLHEARTATRPERQIRGG